LTPILIGLLAVHAAAWVPALAVTLPQWRLPLVQSMVSITCGVTAWFISRRHHRWRRTTTMLLLLAAFVVLTVGLPLPERYKDIGYMGDGLDLVQNPDKFPHTEPVVYFKAHLGTLILGSAYRTVHDRPGAPVTAFRILSAVGAVLCAVELAGALLVFRGSRRVCRFIALALAAPFTLGYYGYYEVGYLAISAGAFPLLLAGLGRRARLRPLVDAAGGLQGLHAALHGIGLLGIAGGALTIAVTSVERRWWTLSRYLSFATAGYLGWIAFYVLVLHFSVLTDPTTESIAFRGMTTPFYYDRRLVDPLFSQVAWSEIGAASLATGVPLLVLGAVMMRRGHGWVTAAVYSCPGLVFLIFWWSTLGPRGDLDLFLAIFFGVTSASWLASRSTRSAIFGLAVLALAHVSFWATIATPAFERIWIE
jgi:hypothetical protein